jgi:hypothetical protein
MAPFGFNLPGIHAWGSGVTFCDRFEDEAIRT